MSDKIRNKFSSSSFIRITVFPVITLLLISLLVQLFIKLWRLMVVIIFVILIYFFILLRADSWEKVSSIEKRRIRMFWSIIVCLSIVQSYVLFEQIINLNLSFYSNLLIIFILSFSSIIYVELRISEKAMQEAFKNESGGWEE